MKRFYLIVLVLAIAQTAVARFSITFPIVLTGRLHFGENVDSDQFYPTNYFGVECRLGDNTSYAIGEFTFNCPLFLYYTIDGVEESPQIDLHGIYSKASYQRVLGKCGWLKYSLGPSIASIDIDGYKYDYNFTGIGIMNEIVLFNCINIDAGLWTNSTDLLLSCGVGFTGFFELNDCVAEGIYPDASCAIKYDTYGNYSYITIGCSVGMSF